MYSTANGLGAGITDGTGTINPAALSGLPARSHTRSSDVATDQTQGLKRSRSPDNSYGGLRDNATGEDETPRKRGRPSHSSPEQKHYAMPISNQTVLPQTPQSHNATLPATAMTTVTPTQVSPPKPTPSKSVIKALPTVRDHTTDQLGPEGDEYVPREYDEAGEKKVDATGHLKDGREYRCRTFFVPNRGDKLFMLATECARVLGYRDSYLLFNKNRSLFKIIATQAEKEDLIHQEILPFSYRSRQIAIVTAKSMFRQFGSRVIKDGRRVRDDYWETKARKQGFTEDDLAGEKRPGAAKARDAAAAAEANANATAMLGHHADIVYSNGPAHFNPHPQPQAMQPNMMGGPGVTQLPMITLAPDQSDIRLRDFSSIARPRQEISGPAYQDRTQPSAPTELLTQAHHTAEYNKQINQQRNARSKYMTEIWRQRHDQPANPPASTADHPPATQSLHSPHVPSSNIQPLMPHQSQPHVMGSSYAPAPHQGNPLAQSPMRSAQAPLRPDQMHGRSPSNLPLGSTPMAQGHAYGYGPSNQMWPPPQPQHNYSYASQPPQPSPHHASPQMRQPGTPLMQSGMQYPGMQGIAPGYAPNRGMYQGDPNQQYMQQATTAGSQPGAQGWAPQSAPPPGNWAWGNQQ